MTLPYLIQLTEMTPILTDTELNRGYNSPDSDETSIEDYLSGLRYQIITEINEQYPLDEL